MWIEAGSRRQTGVGKCKAAFLPAWPLSEGWPSPATMGRAGCGNHPLAGISLFPLLLHCHEASLVINPGCIVAVGRVQHDCIKDSCCVTKLIARR